MHDGMPYDPIQGKAQGHGALNSWKLHFSSSISSAVYKGIVKWPLILKLQHNI